jgi:hypothetical protein
MNLETLKPILILSAPLNKWVLNLKLYFGLKNVDFDFKSNFSSQVIWATRSNENLVITNN